MNDTKQSILPRDDAGDQSAALPTHFWRGLEELAQTDAFLDAVAREFPRAASEWSDPIGRRRFLKLMAASLALAGIGTSPGCYEHPQGKLVPYPQAPEEIIPGRPLYFATAMPARGGYGVGVLALSREGRPIKVEGNPDHPASLGATDVFTQASVLDLYDPDRSRNVTFAGEISSWGAFDARLQAVLTSRQQDGRGLRLLTGPITSPTAAGQLADLRKRFPNMVWHQHDPMEPVNTRGAARLAFGAPLRPIYDFGPARVILSLGSDFLFEEPLSVRYAREFVNGRRVRAGRAAMNRLYVVEPTMTLTGSMADHRLPLGSRDLHALAAAVARGVGVAVPDASAPPLPPRYRPWIDAFVADLRQPSDGGPTLVVAGESQPPAVHLLAHAINDALGNIGKTVRFLDPVAMEGAESLEPLVADMNAGQVDALLILGVNPAYSAPADVSFADALARLSNARREGELANFTARLGSHDDETSFRCQWHLPEAHYLEAWSDVRAYDGTISLIQPLIAPLYGGRTQIELLQSLLGRGQRTGMEVLQAHWRSLTGEAAFQAWWIATLQKGIVAGSTLEPRTPPAVRRDALANPPPTSAGGVEVLFRPDPTVWTGEYANNPWLQETPKPFTKLTWDNAVLINVRMAQSLGADGTPLKDGDVVRVTYRGRAIEAPVLVLPGQADNVATLHLGYGRERMGRVAMDDTVVRGFNAYLLRAADRPWGDAGATLERTGGWRQIVVTRNHHAMDELAGLPGEKPSLKPHSILAPRMSDDEVELHNRKIVRVATLAEFRDDPEVIHKAARENEKKPLLSLYPGWDYEHGFQWGMSIDQTACIGCNACMVACQAENNIPVVGKAEVARQREMHWIRIDSYFGGAVENPLVVHQPVPCMHCENAPCEVVCPVGATTHSDEGLNEMTYNRCIGTRYCSNNCPYKVRRFNFLLYSNYDDPSVRLRYNPDVTVRSRGVMEKCTYCVQRIDQTRIHAEKEVLDLEELARHAADPDERDRLLHRAREREQEIVNTLQTACQQACPTNAIIFGNIRDPQAGVTRLKAQPHDYSLLAELTTKPRTTYLGRITNPNPALASFAAGEERSA